MTKTLKELSKEAPPLPVILNDLQVSFKVCVDRHEALLTRLLASYEKHLKRLTEENEQENK